MIETHLLEELAAFAEYQTLSRASKHLHISQPTLSRSMQKLESDLQVPLFERQKNKMVLNENGKLAVDYAQRVLQMLRDMTAHLHALERSRHTISIGSCAPAPVWFILPELTRRFSEMTISAELKNVSDLLQGLEAGLYQMIVIPHPVEIPGCLCHRWGAEHLFLSLPPMHPLAERTSIRLDDLAGETMLLFTQIGFWHEMHQKMMPNTRFLLQEERFTFNELVKASTLPSFTSDLVFLQEGLPKHRVTVPIDDPAAAAEYYCVYTKDRRRDFETLSLPQAHS